MLLLIAVENYRSFAGEAVLDLQRRSFKKNRPSDDDWAGVTSRAAGIFGANASGKSNILRAIKVMKDAIEHSGRDGNSIHALQDPHREFRDDPTTVEVEYVAGNIRYRYYLEVDDSGIVSESLEANVTGHWRRIFVREREHVTWGRQAGVPRAARELIAQALKPTALVMSVWTFAKTPGEHIRSVQWWTTSVKYMSPGELEQSQRHRWAIQLVKNDPQWLRLAVETLRIADVGVTDLEFAEQEVPAEIRRLTHALNKVLKEESGDEAEVDLGASDEKLQEVFEYLKFIHISQDGQFELPENQESLGTRVWFDMVLPVIHSLVIGGLVAIDELDASLHPVLVRELIRMFQDSSLNLSGAQLVFTSHDITIMGHHPERALDSEEAWLVNKEDGVSELVSWDTYDLRSAHNLENRYLQGVFGGLPLTSTFELRAPIEKLREQYKSASRGV